MRLFMKRMKIWTRATQMCTRDKEVFNFIIDNLRPLSIVKASRCPVDTAIAIVLIRSTRPMLTKANPKRAFVKLKMNQVC